MENRGNILDRGRLEKVRQIGGRTIARCPACAEHGGDRKGNHLVIFPSGKFACAAFQGDSEHRRRIFALAGHQESLKTIQGQFARRPQPGFREGVADRERDLLRQEARSNRDAIISRHQWHPEDVWEDSPQRVDCDMVEKDPRWFISSLFQPTDVVWTGEVYHSGRSSACHWGTAESWSECSVSGIGPMVSPAVWKPGTVSRKQEHVAASPYVVLDFDGFDGVKPDNPDKVAKLRSDSLALIHWIREGLRWKLAALLCTGSKSIHAWFHNPPVDVTQSLRGVSEALGVDSGLVGRPEHPCRLPGQIHAKTGQRSRVLWLDTPIPPNTIQK